MARVISMVVKLDSGKYRTIKLHKIRSIYTAKEYICDGQIDPGHGDVAGPETDKPEFKDEVVLESAAEANGDNGDGEPPHCYLIDGVWICI